MVLNLLLPVCVMLTRDCTRAVFFRSPSVPMRQLVQLITRFFQRDSATGVPTAILGDFNDYALCDHYSELQVLMVSHGYLQLVNEPGATDRATLIDHVYFSSTTSA